MAFVSYPLCTPSLSNRQVVSCAAKNPRTPRNKNTVNSPLVGQTNPSNDPVAKYGSGSPVYGSSSASTTSDPDVWDTLIDDHTLIEDIVKPEHQASSPQTSTVDCAQARMAAQPSHTPKPELSTQTEGNNAPEKKRGRPKGSKSERMSPTPPPQVSPFMAAVREDLRRRNMAAKRDLISRSLGSQSGESINWDQLQLSAPNGLPNEDGSNSDLLQELLPILAQQENEENRVISEEEKRIKRLISTCYTQVSSIHRSNDRLDNLKPYKLKKESEKSCQTCSGTGMVVCEYCDGQGYVNLGKNGEKFNPKFGDNILTMPKHVMGDIYHCPLCGGLQEERCTSCFGTGTTIDGEEATKGASKEPKDNRAWKIFDMDELIRQESDRIEIGLDGTVIMRAKRRGRRKKTAAKDGSEKSPMRKGRHSRPPKGISEDETTAKQRDDREEPETVGEDGVDLPPNLQSLTADTSGPGTGDDDQSLVTSPGTVAMPRGRSVVRTTDFVNTTDYQIGRRLQRQDPTVGQSFLDSPNLRSSTSQEKQDEVEKVDDTYA